MLLKKKSNNKYKVTVNVGDFLKYQVWSSTNANNINGDRSVFLLHAKDWVEQFKIVNSNSDVSKSFTPTTVIEIDNEKYVTIITNAEFKNKKVIFHMSTDDVKFNSKKMKKMNKLPKGEFLNVRFDIDDIAFNQYCNTGCNDIMIPNGVTINCVNLCNGYDSCVVETAPWANPSYPPIGLIDGGSNLNFTNLPLVCTEINGMSPPPDGNTSTTDDQFLANLEEGISLGACSML